ncbi:MAG TPA: hypothetical protein VJ912_03595 [Candidatus Nanoarchaeia archaeon]|nr:hypothetical protein [Candidatus Nanoarchaeia archaeon]
MPKTKQEIQNERQIIAWLSVFLTIIGFLIAILTKKEDKYVMYYARHGLVLFICFFIAGFLTWIPIIGWLFWFFIAALWILTWINALSMKKKRTILVTDLAEKIDV